MAYIGATILFILALGGLSKQETNSKTWQHSRNGWHGRSAFLVTIIVRSGNEDFELLFGAMAIGGIIGFLLAKKLR